MSARELSRFTFRRRLFMDRGFDEARAEAAADRLVDRDRELDTRHLCVECEHLKPPHACRRRDAVLLEVLQRCPNFKWQVPT
jgi:hypothetical protein